eukprot:TRINITY_DN464_c0_g2_i1.p1 TRINITY_DN464_c0_g2~~TRINITY_DN464_c0_g2_i1.p1  ORF type:complete len:390 (+),score=45.49 TRINITY_DN464_c0_g2_i1:1-1170(+)
MSCNINTFKNIFSGTPIQALQLLELLHCINPIDDIKYSEGKATWDLKTANYFEYQFIQSSQKVIQDCFSSTGDQQPSLRIIVDQETNILSLKWNGVDMTHDDVEKWKKLIEDSFEKKEFLFHYKEIAERILVGCSKIAKEHLREIIPSLDDDHNNDNNNTNSNDNNKTNLSRIRIEFNSVSGVDDMIQYETKWCAWPRYGFISMPDIWNLPSSHINFMKKESSLGLFYAIFCGRCYRVPCHEIIHIIQDIANQRGNYYTAEHDASYVMLPLLCQVSTLPELKDLFTKGVLETMIMSTVNVAKQTWKNWSHQKKQIYERWKLSFGLVEIPEWQEGPEGVELENEMKGVIAVEGLCPNGEVKMPDSDQVRIDPARIGNICNITNKTGGCLK